MLLITPATSVHHANPLRPAITELTKPAATDVPQPAPAVQLAQAVNRLLLAAVAHAINTNLVQQNAPALPTPKPIAKQLSPQNTMLFAILKLPEIGSTAPDNQKPAAGRPMIAEGNIRPKPLVKLPQLKRPAAAVLSPGHIAAQKGLLITATLFNYLPNTKKALCISTKSFFLKLG